MALLRKTRKIIFGGLAGGCITMFGPVSPVEVPQNFFTLEELAYQHSDAEPQRKATDWEFQWEYPNGFMLRKEPAMHRKKPIHLR